MASVENPNSTPFGKREIGETIDVYSAVASVELEFPDSDVCRGSAMAKASRQVSEFEDTYGLYKFFCQKLIFEREDFDPFKHYMDDMDDEFDKEDLLEDMRKAPYNRHAVLKYIEQIRQSFGFDLDVNIPIWLTNLRYFIRLDMSIHCDCDRPCDRYYVHEAAKFAIDEINADLNSKSYELVKVVKCVLTITYYSLKYLTLTTKKVGDTVVTIQAIVYDPRGGPMELQQWRFKPADAAAAA